MLTDTLAPSSRLGPLAGAYAALLAVLPGSVSPSTALCFAPEQPSPSSRANRPSPPSTRTAPTSATPSCTACSPTSASPTQAYTTPPSLSTSVCCSLLPPLLSLADAKFNSKSRLLPLRSARQPHPQAVQSQSLVADAYSRMGYCGDAAGSGEG